MAKQVLPIVGGVVGAFFGMPQLGFLAGSLLASAIPEKQSGPGLGDLPVQKSEEGIPRAVGYGTFQCTGYLLDFGPPIETYETPEGAKGGEENQNNTIYRNYAVAICEGPIAAVLRIWENDKLVYDVRPNSLMIAESVKWATGNNNGRNLFLGTEDQPPSVFLELNVSGVGTTPSYAGTAYMVFGLEDLTESRGAIPQYRFEVAKSVTPNVIALPRITVGSRAFAGQTGGGTIVNMLNTPAPMDPPGDVWLGYFELRSTGPATTPLYLQVLIDDVIVWQRLVELPDDNTTLLTRVQINNIADGRMINTAILGTLDGQWTVGIVAINGDKSYEPYSNGPRAPRYYESSDDNFGIVRDPETSLLYSLRYINPAGAESWGPPLWTNGYYGGSDTLGAIVADLHDRCGIAAEDLDVSELDDTVRGFVAQGDYDAAGAIDSLRSVFFFDRCEDGEMIRYPKRGKAVVETLTIDDLVEVPDLSKREQTSEIPKKLHLVYPNPTAGYSTVKADSEIRTGDFAATDETTVQTTVVMESDAATQTVAKMHKVMAADAQGEIKITVPQQLLRLLPSDCIGLSLRGQVRRLRIEQADMAEGKIDLTLRIDRQSAYTSNLTGIPIEEPTPPPSTIVGDTELAVMDISSRVDTEDDLHYLVAGSGSLPGWYGWTLQRSLDGGANYTTVQQFRGAAVMGSLVDPVPTASEFFTDTTNTVRVALFRQGQSLDSVTIQDFLSEGGAFALEKPDGTWEVMQYLDATLESNGDFTLSTLHRGQLNSSASAHDEGATFVLLTQAQHIPAQSAWIGQELTSRAVSLEESPETGTVQTITYQGRSQLEWPVAYLTVTRDGSDVLTGTWTPRHRFGTEDAPVASINFQGYRVTLSDGVDTVSFDRLTPDFTYDASAMASPVTVSVSSINRITGPGPATSVTA